MYMKERGEKEIVLKAMGQAISKTVAVAEIIKVGINFTFSLKGYTGSKF